MKSDTLLDHAVFQLSPRRSRCDLFVFGKGKTDKLASGFVMPFVTHLKAAEEQIALSVQAIKLKVEQCRNSTAWFTKGTLERFVRFVSTPEILEFVNTLDSEMSHLEAAQNIYSEGAGDHVPGPGGSNSGARAKSDESKKELLRAIDLRLSSVRQDLSAAFSHAASAGFDLVTVTELQMFADQFSARRLNEACHKFLSFCNRRVDLIDKWTYGTNGHTLLSSSGSEISIDVDPTTKTHLYAESKQQPGSHSVTCHHLEETTQSSIIQKGKNSTISSQVCFSRGSGVEKEDTFKNIKPGVNKEIKERRLSDRVNSVPSGQHVRRPRMQDRIKRSEIKKDDSRSGGKPVIRKSATSRRHSSQDKMPRRWSCVSDTGRVLAGNKTDTRSLIRTRSSATASQDKSQDKEGLSLGDSASDSRDSDSRDQVEMQSLVRITGSGEEMSRLNPSAFSTSKLTDASVGMQLVANSSPAEYGDGKNQNQWYPKVKLDFNGVEHDKDQTSSEAQFKSDVNTALKINLERILSDHEQVKGIMGNSSENDSSYGNSTSIFSCENVSKTSDCHDAYSTPPATQVRRVKSKENIELNDKLNMKANELEKLFAEHKLRVPAESSSNRRSWVAGISSEPAANSSHQTPVIDAAPVQLPYNYRSVEPAKDFSSMGIVENYGDAASNHFSESSRGKYYDTYLQRRNKKLTDEWSSRREEKEAKFKSMQDSFESSMAEITAKFSCPTNRDNSVSTRH